jgi:hypothetical protein
MRLIHQVINPRLYTVGNDVFRLILLHEFSNGLMEKHCTFRYLGHCGRVHVGGQWFNAFGKVDLLRGEVDDVKAEEEWIDGGERFGKEMSISRASIFLIGTKGLQQKLEILNMIFWIWILLKKIRIN